jgi:chromosome partitioning protein
MKIITIASLKGGVGKTTTAVYLALAMHAQKRSVLVIDADPNNNLTDFFLRDSDLHEIEARNLYHLISGKLKAEQCIHPAGLDVIPCTLSLCRVGIELATNPLSMLRFGANLRKLDYDVILIDTPPSPGYELRAALHASDLVLSPVGLSRWSVQALDILRGELLDVQADLGRAPDLLAIAGMVTPIEEQSLRISSLADQLTYTSIHRSAAIRKAAATGSVLKSGSRASLEFESLAKEVA